MTLFEWRSGVLGGLRRLDFAPPCTPNVTLLAYFFFDDERIETAFPDIECAILCAYRAFGLLPTVFVVNRTTETIEQFVKKYGVVLQIDESLVGGVEAMNRDCNGKLYKRFKTDYVLIVESDGMPVNSGLERFVGKWDYIGAPWPIHTNPWYLGAFPPYRVGNSGFSLRSRRICEMASRAYCRYWKWLPYFWLILEDVFLCKTLRWFWPSFRRSMVFPDVSEAAMFSLEYETTETPTRPPLGFHSERGFQNYVKRYGIPLLELMKG